MATKRAESRTERQQAAGQQRSDARLAAVAVEDADVLQAAGQREANVLTTAGQRKINLLWEATQAAVAIMVTAVTLGVCSYLVIAGKPNDGPFLLLSNVFFLIVGTYFQRTNHTKVGGITEKGDR